MDRKFKAKQVTYLKFGTTEQASVELNRKMSLINDGTELTTEGIIKDAGSGHLSMLVRVNIFGDHIEEIKPEIEEIVSFEKGQQLFGSRYTQARHQDLQRCLSLFNIKSRNQIRHFLSQCGHESAGLRYTVELASGKAYEGRRDLGNTQRGWGVLYKGGGFIQLTGRVNYMKLFNHTNDNRVLTDGAKYVGRVYPWTSAGVWWDANGMNKMIDRGATVRQVTRRVNGGYNGLADRERWWSKTAIF